MQRRKNSLIQRQWVPPFHLILGYDIAFLQNARFYLKSETKLFLERPGIESLFNFLFIGTIKLSAAILKSGFLIHF